MSCVGADAGGISVTAPFDGSFVRRDGGFSGGKLRTAAQANLHVPLDDMGIVESIHLTAFHWVVDDLYRRISM